MSDAADKPDDAPKFTVWEQIMETQKAADELDPTVEYHIERKTNPALWGHLQRRRDALRASALTLDLVWAYQEQFRELIKRERAATRRRNVARSDT